MRLRRISWKIGRAKPDDIQEAACHIMNQGGVAIHDGVLQWRIIWKDAFIPPNPDRPYVALSDIGREGW